MIDNEWPRFEVFLQEKPGRPHQYVGSVHAADPELALLNARDVFVRRPECASLWIAPAQAVWGATAEELAAGSGESSSAETAAAQDFLVFAKLEQRGTLVHTGQVHAAGPQAAVAAARRSGAQRPLVIWVIPAERVTRSLPEDVPSMFDPSRDKRYRDQAFYHVQTALQRLRRQAPIADRSSQRGKP